MLTKFKVERFKAFKGEVELRLDQCGNYEFCRGAVKNGIVNKGILYGYNGCGKSTLGFALMDIILHLTDKTRNVNKYVPYLNMDSGIVNPACFEYCFEFDGVPVRYVYKKRDIYKLIEEELFIDGRSVVYYDFSKGSGHINLKGAETLKYDEAENGISRVKYVKSNAILTNHEESIIFDKFIDFVDGMLMFYSLDEKSYMGLKTDSESISDAIVREDMVKSFEEFLNRNSINVRLGSAEINGSRVLVIEYEKGVAEFFTVASTGMKAMALFFYWFMNMKKASFVYMDEFDAFYHFELAEDIVKMVREIEDTQVLFTTHNTDLISNDILRPDCYFKLYGGEIKSFNNLTEKELRKAHNIQKMFKAGAFNE